MSFTRFVDWAIGRGSAGVEHPVEMRHRRPIKSYVRPTQIITRCRRLRRDVVHRPVTNPRVDHVAELLVEQYRHRVDSDQEQPHRDPQNDSRQQHNGGICRQRYRNTPSGHLCHHSWRCFGGELESNASDLSRLRVIRFLATSQKRCNSSHSSWRFIRRVGVSYLIGTTGHRYVGAYRLPRARVFRDGRKRGRLH